MAPTAAAEPSATSHFFTPPGVRACLRGSLPERERRGSGTARSPPSNTSNPNGFGMGSPLSSSNTATAVNSDSGQRERSTPRRRRFVWRRPSSAHSATTATNNSTSRPSHSLRLDSTNNGTSVADRSRSAPPARTSFRSTSSALPPRPRSAALRKLFERATQDGRWNEDLRSTKRRIIQVSRQDSRAPALCSLGFRSRTGWEPIRAVRENQDCLVALLPWGPQGQYSLYGALDGHGRAGHHASLFVAQRIVSYLLRALKKSKVDVAHALSRAFDYAEQRLESSESNIDCTVSGTTGVFVLLDRTMLYCANVGDSRAVLGRKRNSWTADSPIPGKPAFVENVPLDPDGALTPGGSYEAIPLSFDHKPTRMDEKQRIENSGGRVDAWQSCDVGAERVWLKDSRTPGLAVTRSFGDFIVRDIGVIAHPEIYSLPLCSNDRFIVIASDGVYEFLSNEDVIAIVSKFRESGTPQNAAEEVVKVAAERWIDDDSVIDDISCIVVFVDIKESFTREQQLPRLVHLDHQQKVNPSVVNTPLSSRANSYRPGTAQSGMLFGQYSNVSSGTGSRATSNAHLTVPKKNSDVVSNPSSRLQRAGTSTGVHEVVRKYAQKMTEDVAPIQQKRAMTSPPSRPVVKTTNGRSDIFGVSKFSGVAPANIGDEGVLSAQSSSSIKLSRVRRSLSNHSIGRNGSSSNHSVASDVEMYDENAATAAAAAAFQGGDVSDSSSRFEDADEDAVAGATEPSVAMRINPNMSTKGMNIAPSDDEDDEKYADADTLVPIDNHAKVVRREMRKQRAAADRSLDRRELSALNAALDDDVEVRRSQASWFRGIRARRAAAATGVDDSSTASGRLRRLLPKRPRSSFSADGF